MPSLGASQSAAIDPQLIAFIGLVVLTMIPGATTMLVISSVVSSGQRTAWW
jgi:threonine/homoserine/homoserine lactone efflux protein